MNWQAVMCQPSLGRSGITVRHGAPDTGGSERQCSGEVIIFSLPGGLDGSDEPTGRPELKGVCVRTHFSGLVLRSVEITR